MTRRRIVWIAGIALAVILLALAILLPLTSARAKRTVVHELSQRLDSTVELESLDLNLLPMPHASGANLVIRKNGRQDEPPLISIDSFRVSAGIVGLLRHHVAQVELDGLEIDIPPDNDESNGGDDGRGGGESGGAGKAINGSWVIDRLHSTDAKLAILSSKPNHDPKVWTIHDLRMQSVGRASMPFDATLTNAVPPGQIDVTGHFGPWNTEAPGGTPLDGDFTFANADLGVFKGISGILSAQGRFDGSLSKIAVDGNTDTPQFVVQAGGHPVHLRARYHAVVDGLNGNTALDPVDATINQTRILARGGVFDSNPGEPGREVRLDVTIEKGRIEDVLLLAVPSQPPLQGALTLNAKMVLPPGDRDVTQKLKLDGSFSLENATFRNEDVSRKIAELSRRSRGKVNETKSGGQADGRSGGEAEDVSSDFAGRFTLGEGRLSIPAVSFRVPGAAVRLHGTYALTDGAIDFHGALLTDVKVSEMTSGWKSFLLKLVDPLFHRDGGGADIPIQVTGTRDNPSFGLDKSRVF
jgi:hypothetical protein